MIVTIFRSHLRPEAAETYAEMAAEMSALAATMPGYIAHKSFTAPDGERVTIVEFESPATHRAWAAHHGHREAQRMGREIFYADFSVQVCEVLRTSSFRRKAEA